MAGQRGNHNSTLHQATGKTLASSWIRFVSALIAKDCTSTDMAVATVGIARCQGKPQGVDLGHVMHMMHMMNMHGGR